MSLLTKVSQKSRRRGYEYFINKTLFFFSALIYNFKGNGGVAQ